MGLFKKRSASRKTKSADHAAIKEFVDSRRGVEAYLEPRTSVTQTTVVFVAHDGEHMRKPFETPKAAADFTRKLHIPLYDTNKVGYPQRMRDYNLRARQRSSSQPRAPKSTPTASTETSTLWTSEQLKAIRELEFLAEVDMSDGKLDKDEVEKLVRTARAKAHPDRNGGDRSAWDRIDRAARLVDLH